MGHHGQNWPCWGISQHRAWNEANPRIMRRKKAQVHALPSTFIKNKAERVLHIWTLQTLGRNTICLEVIFIGYNFTYWTEYMYNYRLFKLPLPVMQLRGPCKFEGFHAIGCRHFQSTISPILIRALETVLLYEWAYHIS